MTICRFYQQGGQQQQYGNRFGALAGQGYQGNQGNQGMGGRVSDSPPYAGLTAEIIERDLRNEPPQWLLSCYGPGRDAPEQLWGGYPREQSFEEIRLHFMMGAMAGNPQGALNDIQNLYQSAQQQIQHTLNNLPAAVQFIVDGGNKHPNRIDVCKGETQTAAPSGAFGSPANAFQKPAANPFGAQSAPTITVGGFGQPAALGQKPNPFGAAAPAFAQPAQSSAFGQPAALGGGPAFGQPAQPGGTFGQTGVLGAKPDAFAAAAQPAAGPAFGQSAFGQTAALNQRPAPFGTPATAPGAFGGAPPANNPFGQPASQAQTAPTPFGQPATTQPANNPFGQAATIPANPFAQAQAQAQQQQQPAANPFGAAATPAAPANPFGQPPATSAFAQPATTSAFAKPESSSPLANQPPSHPATLWQRTNRTGFAAPAPPLPPPAPKPQAPTAPTPPANTPISAYSSKGPNNLLTMFKGRPVVYEEPKSGGKAVPMIRNFDGSMVRIWMPNGAPPYTDQTEAEPTKYGDPNVLRQWKAFVETGRFEGGVMPEVPPRREWCQWDL
ncbi:hypothetical protein N0V88_006726 [Collariella sp. IMI 366227]|nr:hypothetical protein N0V88_006726 [Collariella sp. IMI 366227]